jgi:hypothetical protein
MTTPYKSMYTIFMEQKLRRDNYEAVMKYGLFKTKQDFDVYHERIEEVAKQEVKAMNQYVKSLGRKSNV